ncbi:hypothetical protein GCM10009113_04000 [Marinobacter szutsaonensis]
MDAIGIGKYRNERPDARNSYDLKKSGDKKDELQADIFSFGMFIKYG